MSKYSELKQTLEDVLLKIFKIPQAEVESYLPEDEENFSSEKLHKGLIEADKKRIVDINQRGQDKFDEGYKKGQKESLSNLEKTLKSKYSVDEDLKAEELVDAIVSNELQNTGKGKLKVEDLTEDEVKKLPAVIKLMDSKVKEFKEKLSEKETEFETFKTNIEKQNTFSKVKEKAIQYFESLNPILSDDPIKASNQKELLIANIQSFDYQINGDDIVILKDGKLLEDDHANRIDFNSFIKSTANKFFDFKAAEHRDTPPSHQGRSSNFNAGQLPKSEEEYAKFITDSTIPIEERTAVQEAWQNRNSA